MNTIFVSNLQPALKHPTVFKKFDELKTGESFLLVNDHDPIPLFYEMKAERGNGFEWKKIENGPEIWKVEIKKTGNVLQHTAILKEEKEDSINVIFDLDVTQIEPRLKHPTIFKYFDALKPGEAFLISNDHDPKPLYYQLLAERGNIFTWDYREKGPQWWKVQIKKMVKGKL
jgi:regulator of cell morphogenesis and NO signaling